VTNQQVRGWIVVVQSQPGPRKGKGNEHWYACVADPSIACEQVSLLANVGPGLDVWASHQITEQQINALGIAPGEVRPSPKWKPASSRSASTNH
jgi:hypothetical protein